jgi:hypothetical protein
MIARSVARTMALREVELGLRGRRLHRKLRARDVQDGVDVGGGHEVCQLSPFPYDARRLVRALAVAVFLGVAPGVITQ